MKEILSVAGHLAGVIVRKVGLVDVYVGFRRGADVPEDGDEEEEGLDWAAAISSVMAKLPMIVQALKDPPGETAPPASETTAPAGVDEGFSDVVKIRCVLGVPWIVAYETMQLRAEGSTLATALRALADLIDVETGVAEQLPICRAAAGPCKPAI